MIRTGNLAIAAIAGLVMSLLIAPTAQAQADDQMRPQASRQYRVIKYKPPSRQKQASKRDDQTSKRDQASKQKLALVTKPAETARKPHQLLLQVNSNEPAMMNLALNNATNVAQYYRDIGEDVSIEVVTFGPGLHMLRDDTSPVKARIEALSTSNPEISFKACGNTRENMRKAENKDITLLPQATVVKSGVVRVMELQERGWTYVKL
ncbi:DsrE family protein [Bradyrhizobium sp. Ai1a-2]|uniref:DsrE family protein n=1 Tax=Bradyrhizobium sp. Ai1a-2 TaxID=196490 RepID=UPI0004228C48|nr:DsrE family protein [Bradyrhizobium sp. Ai1a-2]